MLKHTWTKLLDNIWGRFTIGGAVAGLSLVVAISSALSARNSANDSREVLKESKAAKERRVEALVLDATIDNKGRLIISVAETDLTFTSLTARPIFGSDLEKSFGDPVLKSFPQSVQTGNDRIEFTFINFVEEVCAWSAQNERNCKKQNYVVDIQIQYQIEGIVKPASGYVGYSLDS